MLSSTATSFGTRLDSWKMPFCDKLTYLRTVFLHLLSNTWVTIPWRARSQTQQMHRGSEICWSLALSGFGIMGTWAVAASLMKNKRAPDSSRKPNTRQATSSCCWPLSQLLPLTFLDVHCSFSTTSAATHGGTSSPGRRDKRRGRSLWRRLPVGSR